MVASKDPGKGHFYVSLVKSGIRILAGASLIFSYDTSEATNYWYSYRRFMNGVTTDTSFCFSPEPSASGSCKSSLLNKPFKMFSSAAFNGGFSADVYVTYAYTKVL